MRAEYGKYQYSYQQYSQQKSENDMVLKELEGLGEDARVYKLIGPALVKQDLVEAKSHVSERLGYIKSEMERLEGQMKTMESKQGEKQQEIMKLQSRLQKQQQKQQ